MKENKDNFGFRENIPDADEIRERFSIEDDSVTLEPFIDENEHREIDADDPDDVTRWADDFQISVEDLKAAILLNGNSVREIKKYLSV